MRGGGGERKKNREVDAVPAAHIAMVRVRVTVVNSDDNHGDAFLKCRAADLPFSAWSAVGAVERNVTHGRGTDILSTAHV